MAQMAGGHLFVINGDLNKLDCDALLVPVTSEFDVPKLWTDLVGGHGGRDMGVTFRDGTRVVRYRQGAQTCREPDVWLGNLAAGGKPASWFAAGLVEFVDQA